MTKLLEEVVRKVAELPDERQDDAAHVLLTMLENDAAGYRLTDAQLREVELAMADADNAHLPATRRSKMFASPVDVRHTVNVLMASALAERDLANASRMTLAARVAHIPMLPLPLL